MGSRAVAEADEGVGRIRFPLMGLGMLALLAALWAGLVRLGWGLPPLRPTLPIAHGPLMVSGFLGTLISLERAVRELDFRPPSGDVGRCLFQT